MVLGLLGIMAKIMGAGILAWAAIFFVVMPASIDWRKWRKTIHLWGVPAALRGAGQVGRFRYRQPLKDLRTSAPGPLSLILLAVASACYLAWSGSITDLYLGFAVVALAAAIVTPLGLVTPPTVLFLAISDYDQFHVLKSMQSRLSLIP